MICDSCPYNKYMSIGFSCTGIVQVPSRSNRYKEPYQAPLMIIGEVPQPGETVSGQILTSRGADIVWKTLQKFELPYEQRPGQAYGTTLFKCAVVKRKSTEKYIPIAIQKCRALLQKEIQQVNPKMILTLGAEATKAVTGQEALKITQVQGTIMQCPYLPEAIVIPLPHPAKMLHAPGEYKVFSQIMAYVASVYNSSANILDPGETDYWVVDTEDKFYRSLSTIDSHIKKRPFPFLACDIETNRLNPRTEGGRILVMGVQFATNKVFVYTPEVFHLLPVLFKGNYWFTWHNGKFDTAWWEERGYHVPNVQDVMLMHYSMNEASGTHDLEQLSQIFLGAEAYKSTANQYLKHPDGMGSAPKEVLYERVAVDCDYTGQLAEQFYPKILSDPNLNKLYHNILMPGSDFLQSMEAIGMAIDPDKLNELGLKYEKQLEELNAQVIEGVGDAWDPDLYQEQTGAKSASAVFKPSSPKQLAWLIYDRLQIRPKRRSKRSTEAEILESIDNPPQFITDLLKYRTVAKEFSTYVTGILKRIERDGRTHGTYQLHITSTGRLSCKDPNLQNIPSIRKDIRRAFVAEPGNVLMECDYKGAELRVLAVLSGVGALGNALIAGQDLHDDLARKYWGENFTKADRMKAKTVNFGRLYAEIKSLSYR